MKAFKSSLRFFAGRALSVLLLFAAEAGVLYSSNYLFFLEVQGIAGYSSAAGKAVFYSMSRMEAMQKPSLGFDYVQKFAGAGGDIATLAVQARLAVNTEGGDTIEPQLYNAYLRLKLGGSYIWAGHNRPKFGLASWFDSHGQLLQPTAMNGFGFDRDWGVGLERDLSWGNAGVSLTTGSGMSLYLKGNYFLSGRIAKGVLNRDNYTVGLSAAAGKVLDVMGVHLMNDKPALFEMLATDATWLRNNWENRVEVMAGKRGSTAAWAVFWRTGVGLLEESRLKLEAQPAVFRMNGKTNVQVSAGISYSAGADWTLRAMVQRDRETKDTRIVFQVYYYKGMRL